VVFSGVHVVCEQLLPLWWWFIKGLEKGLAGRASKSKSKSIAFKSKSKSESLEPKSKSKSSKNGLKCGLESKFGLEYYNSE